MDIVTHSLIGMIGASPLLESQPMAAVAFAFGSVIPDLDALARLFGKRAYLACHQTYTHSLPMIVLVGMVAWGACLVAGIDGMSTALGLACGMTLHSLLDYSNTLGIALFSPFRARRYCLEWVFFLDAVVIGASVLTLGYLLPPLLAGRAIGWSVPVSYFVAMFGYWLLKGVLRHAAGRLAPSDTVALLPSALILWRFLGCRQSGDKATLFRLNLLTGQRTEDAEYTIHDTRYQSVLEQVPEFQLMRGLSPAYHLVNVETQPDGVRLLCRDLRTRNFGTTYGDLEIDVNTGGILQGVRFHV